MKINHLEEEEVTVLCVTVHARTTPKCRITSTLPHHAAMSRHRNLFYFPMYYRFVYVCFLYSMVHVVFNGLCVQLVYRFRILSVYLRRLGQRVGPPRWTNSGY